MIDHSAHSRCHFIPPRPSDCLCHPSRRESPGCPSLRTSNEGLLIPCTSLRGSRQAALYCAHRTSTVSPCAFCEQEGHLVAPSIALSPPPTTISILIFPHLHRMGLGCLRLRASDEHRLIVRVPRATKVAQPHPNLFFSSSFTFPGLALPPLPFITCPTRNPSTCCLPSLNCATCVGLFASTSAMILSSAPSSDT